MVYPMYPDIPAAETSALPPGISVAPESTMRFAKATYHGSREGALHGNLDQLCNQHPVNHSKLPCTTLRKFKFARCGVYRNCICNDPPAYGTGRSSRLSRTLVANSKQTTVMIKSCKEETTSGDFRFHLDHLDPFANPLPDRFIGVPCTKMARGTLELRQIAVDR